MPHRVLTKPKDVNKNQRTALVGLRLLARKVGMEKPLLYNMIMITNALCPYASFCKDISVGKFVHAGDIIGFVGTTGCQRAHMCIRR